MKKVLVTGGFGFIGIHLVKHLLDCPDIDELHVVDSLTSSPISVTAVQEFWAEEGKRVRYTLTPTQDFLRGCTRGFHHVYHLASMVGPTRVVENGGLIAPNIVEDAAAVARYAAMHGSRVLYVSSSEVYGGGNAGLCRETDSVRMAGTVTPRLEYAVGKFAAEVVLRNLCAARVVDSVIVRPFNVAGPLQSARGGFVFPRFVGQALAGRNLTVYGNGSQVRAFTHVTDACEGLSLVMNRGETGRIYNIGNPENRTTIRELAELVLKKAVSRSTISHCDPQTIHGTLFDDGYDKYPDASLIYSLGWRPQRPLVRIVEDTVSSLLSSDDSTFELLTLCRRTASDAQPPVLTVT